MTRYFAELAYHGGPFVGWQNQPHQVSVQSSIEAALATLLRQEVAVVGCGRTDTGVHAQQFFLHFEWEGDFPKHFLSRLNKVLGSAIVIYRIFPVPKDLHARFSATRRSYQYHLRLRKDPFSQQTAFYFPQASKLELERLQAAAALLLDYDEFFPFCKSKSNVKTMRCELFRSEWELINDYHWVFHISANRFLRGMVRLIVGMTLNVGIKKLSVAMVKEALEQQQRLTKSYSVPPQGIFLSEVHYPDLAAEG